MFHRLRHKFIIFSTARYFGMYDHLLTLGLVIYYMLSCLKMIVQTETCSIVKYNRLTVVYI